MRSARACNISKLAMTVSLHKCHNSAFEITLPLDPIYVKTVKMRRKINWEKTAILVTKMVVMFLLKLIGMNPLEIIAWMLGIFQINLPCEEFQILKGIETGLK